MATVKHAQVIASEPLGPGALWLELLCDEPLGFVGGQYIIVDSGLTLPSGKAVKRAYSLLSGDAEQRRVELAVYHLPEGPGSGYMHALSVGARLNFSGPWGKLPVAQAGLSGPSVILATDTGITAALGLLGSQRMQPLVSSVELIWLHPDGEAFLPHAFVRSRIPAGCGAVRIESVPPIGDPGRIPRAREVLQRALQRCAPERVFLTGDGAINYALLDDVSSAGIACTRDNLESFFNMPKKSAPAAQPTPGISEGA